MINPNVIERGCPHDHGNLTYSIGELSYICETCGYRQPTLVKDPRALVTVPAMAKAADQESFTSVTLAAHWGVTEAGAIYRAKRHGFNIGRTTRLSQADVELIESRYTATMAAKPPHTNMYAPGAWRGPPKSELVTPTPEPPPELTRETETVVSRETVKRTTRAVATVQSVPPVKPRPNTHARADRLRLALEHIADLTTISAEVGTILAITHYALAIDDLENTP